ncbi:MAG: cellulase-like family protein, partial [Phycisphaeraceae bacterium]|nr:cellulase-like family protein [Phycisphaeraceae bacterium]
SGGLEDPDRALDELQERGCNAVRIDVFAHLVARDRDGRSVKVFHVPPSPLGIPVTGLAQSTTDRHQTP